MAGHGRREGYPGAQVRARNRKPSTGVIRAEMNVRAVLATAPIVIAAAAITGASAWADRGQPAKHPSTAVENCSTQSGADFPHAFTSPRNLVVGPLSLTGAADSPAFVSNSQRTEGWQKFPLLVREGHRVKVELSPKTRIGAGLAYGPCRKGRRSCATPIEA